LEKQKLSCDDACQEPVHRSDAYIKTTKAVEEKIAVYEIGN
jgi:hypothetical protein